MRAQRAPSFLGSWSHGSSTLLDQFSSGGEMVANGGGVFLSRIRTHSCEANRPVLWFDSLSTSSWPPVRVPLTSLDGFKLRAA